MKFFKTGWDRPSIVSTVVFTATLFTLAGAKSTPSQNAAPPEDIFTNRQIFRIQIEIPEKGMATLRQYEFREIGRAHV